MTMVAEDILKQDPLKLKGKERDEWLAAKQSNIVDRVKSHTTNPEDVRELLQFMTQFHDYSLYNALLIREQWDGAFAVASYKKWNDLGFPVKKGEKGRILVWVPVHTKVITLPNGEKINYKRASADIKRRSDSGELPTKKVLRFTSGFVYDISQTSATIDDYPKIFPNRHYNFNDDNFNYEKVLAGVDRLATEIGSEIFWDETRRIGNAKGAYFPTDHYILMNPLNTPSEVVGTSIHELAHAKLHRNSDLPSHLKELQAELVSTMVCSYFGLNTLDKAVGYIASHTKGKVEDENESIEKILSEVQATVKKFIKVINEEVDAKTEQ